MAEKSAFDNDDDGNADFSDDDENDAPQIGGMGGFNNGAGGGGISNY